MKLNNFFCLYIGNGIFDLAVTDKKFLSETIGIKKYKMESRVWCASSQQANIICIASKNSKLCL